MDLFTNILNSVNEYVCTRELSELSEKIHIALGFYTIDDFHSIVKGLLEKEITPYDIYTSYFPTLSEQPPIDFKRINYIVQQQQIRDLLLEYSKRDTIPDQSEIFETVTKVYTLWKGKNFM